MRLAPPSGSKRPHVVIVGAGVGGLSAAARLAAAGLGVTLLERQATPGGKLRALPSPAGPVDAGPTVLTLRHVFDDLFAACGERLEDHLTLVPQPLLARHYWPDGSRLDLTSDEGENLAAIRAFAGARGAREFAAFARRARALFETFDGPMMKAAEPRSLTLAAAVIRRPRALGHMAPHRTLAGLLSRSFTDPRLAQLFGRYATYVGGLPQRSPALLSLIWQAEAAGVWTVEGGVHRLAGALADLAVRRGAVIRYEAEVVRIEVQARRATGLVLADNTRIAGDLVLFNGDPRALATGPLALPGAVPPSLATGPRSLSADVWSFAARPYGPDLAHHNIFFRDDPAPEFDALAAGRQGPSPTLYVCAQDRAGGGAPPALERFEIIANAPPLADGHPDEEIASCRTRIFGTLARFGLTFDPAPPDSALTTPAGFERLFPQSRGALYGQSPHGMTAAFSRPRARTGIAGLYLCGGGTHPGAGLPMAALSGRHAAEAIWADLTSASRWRRAATPGGTSMASPTTERARSA